MDKQPAPSARTGERRPGEARLATAADTPQLVKLLARAFYDDPFATWVCPSDKLRMRMLERFYTALIPTMLRHEALWTTGDCAGAAIWAPPGQWHQSLRETLPLLRAVVFARLLPRVPLILTGIAISERAHPNDPLHYYLSVLGTDPASQGRGVGSAVIQPVLDLCDNDAIGAYLESSKHANVAFYTRHGFRVTRELDLPRGPRIYLMWREPR